MSSKGFAPHTRQQDERSIVREQRDFSGGLYKDIPSSTIPDNSVSDLKNFINRGNELVGRSGSKKWGNWLTGVAHASLPKFKTDLAVDNKSVVGSTRTLTINNGLTINTSLIGSFVVYANGINEKITNVIEEENKIITQVEEDIDDSVIVSIDLRYQINCLYFHKSLKKIVLLLGSEIYVSKDIYISEWVKAHCESVYKPDNSISTIDEYDYYVLIFNRNGIYRLNLNINENENYFFFKINSPIPENTITYRYSKFYLKTRPEFRRRYIYSLGKIRGEGVELKRTTANAILEIDSGTIRLPTDRTDYTEMKRDGSPDEEDDGFFEADYSGIQIETMKVPVVDNKKEYQWDVFSIWGTTDTSKAGLNKTDDTATNPERYIWIDDVPIMKCMKVRVIGGTNVVVQEGIISSYDVGNTIKINIGGVVSGFIITNITSANSFSIHKDSLSGTGYAYIGANYLSVVTYNSTTKQLTPISSDFNSFNGRIESGEKLFLSNGQKVHIDVPGSNPTIVEELLEDTNYIVCWDSIGRSYRDKINDEVLRARISSFSCYQRFYEELPNNDIGIISNGFIVTGKRDGKNIEYSQLTPEFNFLSGYYHPYYQNITIKDSIRHIKELKDKTVIYGATSTSYLLMSSYNEEKIEELGIVIPIISQLVPVDDNIGVIAFGSIQSLENSSHIMITNEPAIRVFDGNTFSNNLASKKIMDELKSFQQNFSSIYNSFTGYIFWGLNA